MNTCHTPRLLAVVAGAVASVAAYGADAQVPDPNVPVTARPGPYDPLGIRAGGFLIYPSTSVAGSYNDNILATNDDEEDDFIFTVNPQISVVSNFPRHSLGFTVQSVNGLHVDHTDEDYWDFGASLGGRLDITRNNRLTGGINAGRQHEGRDDPDDPGANVTREPVKYWAYGSSLGFEQDFNRFNFGLLGTFNRNDYEEQGEDSDEDERDGNEYGARLRTGYFISPRINAFLQGGYVREQRDSSKSQRDNNVYSAGVGTAIDFTGLLFGEANVGWAVQEFDDSQFQGSSGLDYGVNLTWNPTQLTSLRLDGTGGFQPSDVGASNLTHQIALRVDHELLRNVLIGGQVAYTRDDFQDSGGRVDNRYDVGPDITYRLNRHFSVGAGYIFTKQDSDDNEEEFTRNVVSLRLTAQL